MLKKKQNKKVEKTHFDCKNCLKGTIILQTKETKKDVNIDVKKCTSCKYQYGLKEFWQAYKLELNPDNENDQLVTESRKK